MLHEDLQIATCKQWLNLAMSRHRYLYIQRMNDRFELSIREYIKRRFNLDMQHCRIVTDGTIDRDIISFGRSPFRGLPKGSEGLMVGNSWVPPFFEIQPYEEQSNHAEVAPSYLSILARCPGSWHYPVREHSAFDGHSYCGKIAHRYLENVMQGKRMYNIYNPYVKGFMAWLKKNYPKYKKTMKFETTYRMPLGDENPFGDKTFFGTIDVLNWDNKEGVVTIADYKNGNTPVDAKNNMQLIAYFYLWAKNNSAKLERLRLIEFVIGQREKLTPLIRRHTVEIKKYEDLQRYMERVDKVFRSINERVDFAKRNPAKHLALQCSPFCRATKAEHDRDKAPTG